MKRQKKLSKKIIKSRERLAKKVVLTDRDYVRVMYSSLYEVGEKTCPV